MAGKKIAIGVLVGMVGLFFAVTIAGCTVKVKSVGRIAPGVFLCGRDVSGMAEGEVKEVIQALLPKFSTELYCRFLPEMRGEVEKKAAEWGEKIRVQGNALYLNTEEPLVSVLQEDTLAAVLAKSKEVKVWEWLYAVVTGRPFQTRKTEAVIQWEKEYFSELLTLCGEILERDCVDAAVKWENGQILIEKSQHGFFLDIEQALTEAEKVAEEVAERFQKAPVEAMVLRFVLEGKATLPRLTTERAKQCDTIIATFTTLYDGAGSGRVQNIETGATYLHAKVILPGETFSTAAALMPFTEENGYTAGGTYIDGQLSESIGGGVCQLSTTLYNALLRTRLEITERYSHSMPVGYIPLGQDAAIAGDYKDLKFRNNTKAPMLLLCKAGEGKVCITLYGAKEAIREDVSLESTVIEETEEKVTVEVYRTEQAEGGAVWRERISRDKYRYRETEKPSRIYE